MSTQTMELFIFRINGRQYGHRGNLRSAYAWARMNLQHARVCKFHTLEYRTDWVHIVCEIRLKLEAQDIKKDEKGTGRNE